MFAAIKKSINAHTGFASVQADVLAGLTVGIIALPLSMALAIAVGVPPQHGLYTAMVAGIVIALTGGSQVNISGPTAAFVVVLLPIVQEFGLGGLLFSGFMAGIILILMGVGRLGRLIEVVPYPVIIGFTAGIGVVIATFQIKDFFGLSITSPDGGYIERLLQLIHSLPSINWQELLIGSITLMMLITWPRIRTRIPAHLIALLLGSFVAWVLHVFNPDFYVATIGSRFHYNIDTITGNGIPPLLPSFEWPWLFPDTKDKSLGLSFQLVRELLPAAITIAILGSLESLLCAVVADGMSGKKHSPNDELIGQGIGNIIASMLGGIPATAAIARTAANVKAGGTTPLASVVHGLFILLAILFLAPLLAYIPMASMAALLLIVAWNMSEAKHFIRIINVAPRHDVFVLVTCFLLTVLFDMTIAVGVGMGLAAMLFIQQSISLTNTTAIEHNHDAYGSLPDGIAVYDINGPLFFGSAQKAMKSISFITPDIRVVILDMSEVTMLDMSAIVAMESITENLSRNKIGLIISNLQPRMILKLQRAGISMNDGQLQFSSIMPDAIAKAKDML
jgi:SulP family sulfate permease